MINEFLKFEQKNNLFELELSGVKFWHLMRTKINNSIIQELNDIPYAHQYKVSNNKFKYLIRKLKQSISILENNPYRSLKQKDILILNHHRRVKNNKHFVCLY